MTPYEVTGDELELKGEHLVKFKINGKRYSHVFCVCALSTVANVIIGTDFLRAMDAKLDLKQEELWLGKCTKLNHDSLEK